MPRAEYLETIINFIELDTKLQRSKITRDLNSKQFQELSLEYNLKECSACSGLGVEHIH